MSPQRVFVGLGANLGDPGAALQAAILQISALPGTRWVATSPFYASAPVEAQGPEFLNAAVELRSTLAPQTMLHALQAIEQAHGRERPYRHAPRTLDLDLLLHGQTVMDTPELTLPHPRLHLRAFALQPLLDLAPDLLHPRLGPLAGWRSASADQVLRRHS